jgi:hypothetical protein
MIAYQITGTDYKKQEDLKLVRVVDGIPIVFRFNIKQGVVETWIDGNYERITALVYHTNGNKQIHFRLKEGFKHTEYILNGLNLWLVNFTQQETIHFKEIEKRNP